MGVVNAIGSWYFKKRAKSVFENIDNYKSIQQDTFKRLIDEAKNCQFGVQYNFENIRTYKKFAETVPFSTYEQLFPYIQKILNGQENILWPSDIQWFAKSSGTTNDISKFIPLSFETLEECHFEAGKDVLSLQVHHKQDSKLFEGKGLLIGGSNSVNPGKTKSSFGDLSAVLMSEMPFWANLIKTPDLSIALLENWDEKVLKMAEATMIENVTSISGIPTWTMVILKKVLELSGKNTIKEVWPNLELYIHGGIDFKPYKNQFLEILGDAKDFSFMETYNASEGFFGIQTGKEPLLTLMPHYGIFYEFVNLETGETHTVENIMTNANYEVVISTQSGLWRYRLGDTIKFASINPPMFEITGRTKSYINAFGEELMIHNAAKAIEKVCTQYHLNLLDYTAAPIFYEGKENVGSHEWIIALTAMPEDKKQFSIDFDLALQSVNSDYQSKRKSNLAMGEPIIHLTNHEVFTKWLTKKNKLGGQHKVPRLCNNRLVMDEIKQYL